MSRPRYILKAALPERLGQESLRWWEAELDEHFPHWLRQGGSYILPVPDEIEAGLEHARQWRQLVARALARFDLGRLTYHYVRVA